jgi:glycosyltransferase involved in cell wall biosynthesis
MLEQITPLILTYNEAPNIGRALEHLTWAQEIVVLDSFSDDETLTVASSFSNVRIVQRKFDCHRNQWEFGLRETGITTPWLLALDADYVVTSDLAAELERLNPAESTAGYRAKFIYCINGQRLTCGIYPPVTVLFRRELASYVQDGHTQRVVVAGEVGQLHAPVLHDDRKPLSRWLKSQTHYAELEAQKLLITNPKDLSFRDRLRRWALLVPPATLFYCLVIRGGIFDGWRGFYYAFQRTFAELMLSLYLIESRCTFSGSTPTTATPQPQLSKTAD